MLKYEEADDSLVETFLDVVDSRFGSLMNLKFKLIYDTKRRIRQGKIILASIELVSPKIKFFSIDNVAVEGYDYLIIVDKKAWELADDLDRRRIISHELNHCFIDEKGGLKIIGHDVSDFRSEIEHNQDNPDWGLNLSMLVNAIYEQEKEDSKVVKPSKGNFN